MPGGAAVGRSGCEARPDTDLHPKSRQFPNDLVWSESPAPFQTEGALDVDGRGPSVWDRFETRPGIIIDGSDARVATGSDRRYADDVDLIAAAGLVAGVRTPKAS